jgi:hypothetical protein
MQNRTDKIKEIAKRLLDEEKVDLVLGHRKGTISLKTRLVLFIIKMKLNSYYGMAIAGVILQLFCRGLRISALPLLPRVV